MDLIPVTSKITMDQVPANLPIQVLKSLCDGFFLDRNFNSIQEAVEIAMKELTPQDQSKFIHGVYELFTDIHEVSNATIDSSGQVRGMVKQHNTAQKNKNCVTKKLGDYWQQSPELLEILNKGDGIVDDVTKVVDDVTKVINDVTKVVDDVTELVNEDDEAISNDNESSETAVTPTSVRTKASSKRKRAGQLSTPNPTKDKPINRYDTVVTWSDYIQRDVSIYGKYTPLIVQRMINREPDVFQTATDQIVSGMIALQNAIIRAEETLGEVSYCINQRRKREDERRKRTQGE
ncbi:hypothetical protein K440DRAFT_642137 [Wilcoxina mikolae CBS 423.85]|nr:hypothetical protein K440DRAFT_642137 [Wilcoxina mikolae CBS 423.85]